MTPINISSSSLRETVEALLSQSTPHRLPLISQLANIGKTEAVSIQYSISNT